MTTDKKSTAKTTDKGEKSGKGKGGTYLSIGTSLFSGFTAVKKVRAARAEDDTLQLVDALLRAAVVTTGIVLLVRELRRANDDSLSG
ncbi:hypothetical protein [Actinacidiphila guanduensis]|uniref:Uncharacterized protein n=1 Tax=Actinacidiphila guanduensis TaxID=310781 RepID=A0A1H0RNH1_9ACTN|nr:hypothetical protein [Actinacidiphila guanduensis]SDP30997.1 hypothetical protein SAMN05216259_12330 [Actinacidiphila guanduensis]